MDNRLYTSSNLPFMAREETTIRSIEVGENLDVQRINWTVERIGWWLMAILLALAVLGLFGSGPLSGAQAQSSDGSFTVHYNRFARHGAGEELEVEVQSTALRDGKAEVWISRDFLAGVRAPKIVPEPESVDTLPDRLVLHFRSPAQGGSVQLTLDYTPNRMGLRRATVGGGNGVVASFWQFVYP